MVDPVCSSDALRLVLGEEVDVDATRSVWRQLLEGSARPRNAGIILPGVGPPRLNVDLEAGRAVRIGGSLRGYPVDRSAYLADENGTLGGGRALRVSYKHVHRITGQHCEVMRFPEIPRAGQHRRIELALPHDVGPRAYRIRDGRSSAAEGEEYAISVFRAPGMKCGEHHHPAAVPRGGDCRERRRCAEDHPDCA